VRAPLQSRALGGAAAGLLAAALLAPLQASQLDGLGPFAVERGGTGTALWVALGVLPGLAIALLAVPGRTPIAVPVARGLLVGVLSWAAWLLTLAPLLRGEAPTWDAAAVSAGFAELVADALQGSLAGLLWAPLAARLPARTVAPEPGSLPRVVVLGGGFAGVAAVQRLERLARAGPRWDVTLVSTSNFLLFTPMLAEVAAGALHARHVCAPLRAAAPRTRFLRGVAESVDLERRTVAVRSRGRRLELGWDQLVIAVGSEPSFRDLPGVEEHALALKTLRDAQALREHVLARLDEADLEPDPERRRALVTFAVVGGGFAGAEAVAELRDLVHSVRRYFPSFDADEARFVLVHSRERILPELSAELGRYAAQRLAERGIELRLGRRVAGLRADALLLDSGEEIPTSTVVWTAGNRPARLVERLALPKARGGALAVDAAMRVVGVPGVWAAGDCAAVPDASGEPYPPTAQHAVREGAALGDNVAAALAGREPAPFRFATLGMLAALGHRTGVAEIRGWRFSGALAWALWRGIYFAKLPGLEKRVRVALDWALDLVFPRDIVLSASPEERPAERRPESRAA